MACVCVSPLLSAAEAISLILLRQIDGKRCILQNGARIFGACGCSCQVFVNHICDRRTASAPVVTGVAMEVPDMSA